MALRLWSSVATELRDARLAAGSSQTDVAKAAGLSQARISRTERIERNPPRLDELARHAAVLGLRLSIKAYPEGVAVRDAAQLSLLQRFRVRLHANWTWQSEVPVAGFGDLRAWDAVIRNGCSIAIDAETRLHDVQALQRRCETKLRDSHVDRLILLVADTRRDRAVLREHRAALAITFPLDTAAVMKALARGARPAANGIVVL